MYTAKKPMSCGAEHLTPMTRFVHIDGFPRVWAITLILEKCPNLETIRVAPWATQFCFTARNLTILQARGVQLISGYYKPKSRTHGQPRSQSYTRRRHFFHTLNGERKALFEELLSLGSKEARLASRYYCLRGEEYRALHSFAKELGYCSSQTDFLSVMISGLMHYLDPSIEVRQGAARTARRLRREVAKKRPKLHQHIIQKRVMHEFGLRSWPHKLPHRQVKLFHSVLDARRTGQLQELQRKNRLAYQALIFRFGLEQLEPRTFRTRHQVGQLLGGIPRMRLRLLERRALKQLGIPI